MLANLSISSWRYVRRANTSLRRFVTVLIESWDDLAQGEKADTADADIDKIYTQLNAIGNDDTITTVAELKTALLALVRS